MIFNMHYYAATPEEVIASLSFIRNIKQEEKEETEILYNSYKECEEDCTQ